MGVKDNNYQVVYRGEQLPRYVQGGWVMFQRPKECGGGFWLGRTYDDCFWFEFDRPISLHDGMVYLVTAGEVESKAHLFDDDFELT